MNKGNLFVPTINNRPTKWLVDKLFPRGDVVLLAAKPGNGKSFVTEDLVTKVLSGDSFCSFPCMKGDVVIIDEDSPKDTLYRRLNKFFLSCPGEDQGNLYVHSKEGYNLESAEKLIKEYPDVILVVIDTLVALEPYLDTTSDAARAGQFMASIKAPNRTVILTHHICIHKPLTPMEIILHPNPESLVMNNTRIVSACDTLYLGACPDTDGILRTFYLRPVSRRVTIPVKPFTAKLQENETKMSFEFGEFIDPGASLSIDQKRALEMFKVGEEFTVRDIYTDGDFYFERHRAAEVARELEDKGFFKFIGRKGQGGSLHYRRVK